MDVHLNAHDSFHLAAAMEAIVLLRVTAELTNTNVIRYAALAILIAATISRRRNFQSFLYKSPIFPTREKVSSPGRISRQIGL